MESEYARVSTAEQNVSLQQDALKKAGCTKIFLDHVSGSNADRPELEDLCNHLDKGDTLVVWKLNRLGRSLKHLIELVNDLGRKGVGLKSLKESIDITSAAGKLIFHIFGALAEFELGLISERTRAGLESARVRGQKDVRKEGLSEEAKLLAVTAKALYENSKKKGIGVNEIVKKLRISKPTLYKYLR